VSCHADTRAVRNNVVSITSMNPGHGDNTTVKGVQITPHNCLESVHHLGGADDRINRVVWRCAVPALTRNHDLERVGTCHDRALSNTDLPKRQSIPQVKPQRHIWMRRLQHAIGNHRLRPPRDLLSGLKDELYIRPRRFSRSPANTFWRLPAQSPYGRHGRRHASCQPTSKCSPPCSAHESEGHPYQPDRAPLARPARPQARRQRPSYQRRSAPLEPRLIKLTRDNPCGAVFLKGKLRMLMESPGDARSVLCSSSAARA
jgi:hypothetical protein